MAKERIIGFKVQIEGSEQIVKTIAQLEKAVKDTNKELKNTDVGTERYKELNKQLADSKAQLQDVRKDQRLFVKEAQGAKAAEGSYKQLNATLIRLKNDFRGLSAEARDGIAGQKLINQIQELDTELKQLDTTIGQSQRNVGNYSSAFDGLGGAIGGGISGLASFGFGAAGLGAAGDLLIQGAQQVAEITEQFRKLRGEIGRLTGATGDDLDSFTARISAITTTFGADTDEVLQSATALSKELGITFTESLTAIEKGFIAGADSNGEFLDSLKEYSAQAKAAGLDTAQFISILNRSAKEGVFSDKGIDAVKEFGLRIREQTVPVRDALVNAFGDDFTDQLFSNINDGSATTVDALQKVVKQMNNTQIPGNQLQAIFADVFSAAGEDAGLRFIATLENINGDLNNLEGSASEYAMQQATILGLNEQLAAAQNELSKELSGGSLEFQSLFISLKASFIDGLTAAIKNLKFIASGIANVVLSVKAFIDSNEILKNTIGALIAFFFSFVSITSVIFTQDLPAIFAGFQAAAGQAIDNVKGFFNGLILSAQIASQELNLALSIREETKAKIRKDIAALRELQTEAKASGKTIGQAFNEAFDASVQSQQAIVDRQEAETKAALVAAKKIEAARKNSNKSRVTAEKKTAKEIESIEILAIDAVARRKAEQLKIDEKAQDDSVLSSIEAIRKVNDERIESDKEAREKIKEQNILDREAQTQERIQAGIEGAQLLADTVFQIAANRSQQENTRVLDELALREQAELALVEGNEVAQAEIEAKFNAKRQAIEAENAKRAKKQAIAQASINGALAVTKILAEVPKGDFGIATGILIAGAVATTLAQIAVIGSQKFASGGILSGPSHAAGGISTPFGEMEGGEAVINKRSTKAYKPLLSAINAAGGGVQFQNGGIAGAPLPLPRISSIGGTNDAFIQLAQELRVENQQTKALALAVRNQVVTLRVALDTEDLNDAQVKRAQLDDARTL